MKVMDEEKMEIWDQNSDGHKVFITYFSPGDSGNISHK